MFTGIKGKKKKIQRRLQTFFLLLENRGESGRCRRTGMTWRCFPTLLPPGERCLSGMVKGPADGEVRRRMRSDIPARIARGTRLSWRAAPAARRSPPVGRGARWGMTPPAMLLNRSSHSHRGENPPGSSKRWESEQRWAQRGHIPSKSRMEAAAAAGGQQRTGLRQHGEPWAHIFILALATPL